MSANVIKLPGIKEPPASTPKTDRSVMDTMLITLPGIERWKKPPFQRELRRTPKVVKVAAEIRASGVIPGVLTLGKLHGETFLVDGQHRTEGSFRMACDPNERLRLDENSPELPPITEALADVRIRTFNSMGEMAEEFVDGNSDLARMKNDDIMRGAESFNDHLAAIRRKCPFLGYSNVRMGGKIVLAMSAAIRVWFGSASHTPTPGPASTEALKQLDEKEARRICQVLTVCYEAWGADKENYRLWGTLNLSLVMWLWRRLVLQEGLPAKRGGVAITVLTPEQFRQCLMALSANHLYVEWLLGRGLRERDRSPAYVKIKSIFAGRLGGMGFGRPILPIVDWASR